LFFVVLVRLPGIFLPTYQKSLVAILEKTIELMAGIDEVLPGFPLK